MFIFPCYIHIGGWDSVASVVLVAEMQLVAVWGPVVYLGSILLGCQYGALLFLSFKTQFDNVL